MYNQVVLVPEVENPETVTCIESYDQSIYLGTTNGEIIHYFRAGDEYIFASQQKSKKRAVKGIWLLPHIHRALVLTSTTTSVFSLPEFAPCNMKSMRDVNDISCEEDEITVFSNSAIRIVTIKDDALKLVRNIEYPGVFTGVRRSSYALVASETYDLIDLDNVQKIPLFPVSNDQSGEEDANSGKDQKIHPIIVPIGSDEFLVTSGTKPDEPAMGLVVNINGDISRGTIAWPKYPSSVAVDFPNVAAVIDNQVLVYSLVDQSLVQTIDTPTDTNTPVVVNVLGPYTSRSDEVERKLKQTTVDRSKEKVIECRVESSLFLYTTKVECLVPKSRLLRLEEKVINGYDQKKTTTDEDDLLDGLVQEMDLTSEQSILELEYLKMLIALLSLKEMQTLSPIWFDGSLDPRTVVYIYSPQDVCGDLWMFEGVREMIDSIPKISGNKKHNLRQFYREWLGKRDLESVIDKHQVFASLELAYLRLLIETNASKEDIYAFIDNELVESAREEGEGEGDGDGGGAAQALLLDSNRYFLLSRLYQKQGKTKKVLEAWKKMLTKEWNDSEFSRGEEKMTAYLVQCGDRDLVWEYGLWLAERYTPAVKVFKQNSEQFEAHEVIAALKKFSKSNDEPRRDYLKYLVYEKNSELFTGDLISFLVDDLLEKMDTKSVKKSYEDYAGLEGRTKRSYTDYLGSLQRRNPSELNELRLEVLYLLQSSDYDAGLIAKRMEPYPLMMELCIVRGKLGQHDFVLKTLCHELHDYESAIEYCCEKTRNAADHQVLFRKLFHEFLHLEREEDRMECVRRLLDNWGNSLDTDNVLAEIPGDWPVEILSEYLHRVFRSLLNQKNRSNVEKALARSENSYMTKQARGIRALSDETGNDES